MFWKWKNDACILSQQMLKKPTLFMTNYNNINFKQL